MKTLDEVIRAIEWCTELDQSGCGACPYSDTADNRCYEEDALHYLCEYRMLMDDITAKRSSLEAKREYYVQLIQNFDRNDPLTWEQLKQMEGKPVWIEIGDGSKGWVIIRKIADSGIVSGSDGFVGIASVYGMDNTWCAYRKERNDAKI